MNCEYIHPYSGQCQNPAVEGGKFCAKHSKDPQAGPRRQYLLHKAKYRQRYCDFAESDELRSLKDEIAILRMIMEERLNMVQNDSEMLASCGQIASLAVTIEKLVKSCNQLETRLGTLISKPSLLGVANELVKILLEELGSIENHEVLVDKISDRIIKAIMDAT